MSDSYHELPVLKPPVWKDTIAVYFFVGGLAGASAALAAGARFRELKGITRWGRRVAFGGAVLSAALLIEDLGVPKRFLNMLRVFRPTSPMNVGSWILTAFGAFATSAFLPGSMGDASGAMAGVLGLPLAGYTGVLLANTAVPLWSEARNTLPPLFVASAAVSTSSLFEAIGGTESELRVVRRLAVMSKLAEIGTHEALRQSVKKVDGPLGLLWQASRIGTLASLAISLVPKKPKALRIAGGCLGMLSSLSTRFAIFRGGKKSALDPHATFTVQSALPAPDVPGNDAQSPSLVGRHAGL